MCCAASGGFISDFIVYMRSDEEVFLLHTAANNAEVVRRLTEAAPEGIEVENLHTAYGVIAVQGPRSDEVLEAVGLPTGHDYMSFTDTAWQGRPAPARRPGDTGGRACAAGARGRHTHA